MRPVALYKCSMPLPLTLHVDWANTYSMQKVYRVDVKPPTTVQLHAVIIEDLIIIIIMILITMTIFIVLSSTALAIIMREFTVVPLGQSRSAPGGRQLLGQAANLTYESACRLL